MSATVVENSTPALLARSLDPSYRIPAHVREMSDVITDAVFDGGGRILITMPPRNGKSEHCSHWTPVWFLDQFPKKRVMFGTYESTFAHEWGRKVRNTIDAHKSNLRVRLSGDSTAAHHWNTTEGGGMSSTGVSGVFTGRGADLLVVDDPVKNAEEAASKVYRDRAWNWFTSTVFSRLEPKATIVVIMTRWHEDDLVGRIREHDKDRGRWVVIDNPAIAEQDEVWEDAEGVEFHHRKEGEALWPERYDVADYAEIREQVGSRVWASLYQGRPSPAGGAIFQQEHFRYFTHDRAHYTLKQPDGTTKRIDKGHCWIGQIADTALTVKTTSDFTVVFTFAVTPDNDLLVLNVARARLEVPDQWPFLMMQRDRYRNRGEYRFIGCENKGSGIGLLQLAQRSGVPMRELKAVTDKVTRSADAATLYENGKAYHLQDAPWLDAYETELLGFPNGVHDDQVDTLAYGVLSFTNTDTRPVGEPAQYDEPADMFSGIRVGGAGLGGMRVDRAGRGDPVRWVSIR